MKEKKFLLYKLIILLKIHYILSTSENLLIISIPFETKYIHEIPNDSNEDYYEDYG